MCVVACQLSPEDSFSFCKASLISPTKLISSINRYCIAASSRAARAESFKNSRPTHAPMRNEQGPIFSIRGAFDPDIGIWDTDALQAMYSWVADVESEQGGNR